MASDPRIPLEPIPDPPEIESIPPDLVQFAMESSGPGLVILVAYLRGKLAGYQAGVRAGLEGRVTVLPTGVL